MITPPLSLAIIIPVGPGDTSWLELLPQLSQSAAAELLLVIPQNGDELPSDITLPSNARVVRSAPGRAPQLNAGAAAASSRWLWFLHADSRVTPHTLRVLHDFVASDQRAIGYFDLVFRNDGPALTALNAAGALLRSRWLKLPFGDQGFVLQRELFNTLGGFNCNEPTGEDHALVWIARKQGIPLLPLRAPLYTSARKYAHAGWWRTTARHVRLTISQARRFSALESDA